MSFSTPEEAAAELVAALRAEDSARLERILGPECADLVSPEAPGGSGSERAEFLAQYGERHRVERSGGRSATLLVGALDWPLPIPIVRNSETWRFDGAAGRKEILRRRIGANELDAMQVCLAILDAENEYFTRDRDGDGILEYARWLRSSPGARDGLHWPTGEGEEPSPLGELVAEAAFEERDGGAREPFHGYFYRILTAQGPRAPGGAYDYLAREEMIGGCALIAWPAEYGVTGVMTFVAGLDGRIRQKDLGVATGGLAASITRFDPDGSWQPCAEEPAAPATG